MKAFEAFENLPSGAGEVAEFSRKLIEELNDGEIEPLKFKVFVKCLETVLANIKPTLDELALDEAEKYGQKSFGLLGAKIELREVGTRYNYSQCGYPEWERAEQKFKEISDRKKQIESLLQAVKKPMSMNDEETGEVVTVYPPVKSSTSSVVITLGKGGAQ